MNITFTEHYKMFFSVTYGEIVTDKFCAQKLKEKIYGFVNFLRSYGSEEFYSTRTWWAFLPSEPCRYFLVAFYLIFIHSDNRTTRNIIKVYKHLSALKWPTLLQPPCQNFSQVFNEKYFEKGKKFMSNSGRSNPIQIPIRIMQLQRLLYRRKVH